MKQIFITLVCITFLFAGEWTINDFTIRGKQFTQSATGILQGNLNRIPSYQAPKGDELLLRRRLDMDNYGLYIGKAEASAYANLSRFSKPVNMSIDKLLKTKFYKAKTPTGFDDVMDIYVQGEYIYVQNLVRIFYKDGGVWKSLEVAQGKKPGVLEISSTPSGATVTIDGIVKGKTPYTFVMDAPTVEVEVSKSGYYNQSFTATAKAGEVQKFSPHLNKEISVTSVTNPTQFIDTTLTSIDDAEAVLYKITSAHKEAKKKEAKALEEFENGYPKLKPQDMEFEYDHEFEKRKTAFLTEKMNKRQNILIDSTPFSTSKSIMEQHIKKLDAKRYSLYMPLNSIRLGMYDKYKEEFPLTIVITQGAFDFSFDGKISIPRDAARRFKFSTTEKGLHIKYGKRQVTVYEKDKKVKKYFQYGTLELPFEGKTYELIGKITLPQTIINIAKVKSYYAELAKQERLEKERLAKFQLGMKKIPGGTFQMGSNSDNSDEKPAHSVTVSGFWMDSTEVTQAEYQRLMRVSPSRFKGSNRPVDSCNWYDAVLYCNERSKEAGLDTVYSYSGVTGTRGNGCVLSNVGINYSVKGYRLPTEAEWEYACRAGSTTKYYWGNSSSKSIMKQYAVYDSTSYYMGTSSSYYGTHSVASYKPNSFGLYDMSGNVLEWCNDWYDEKYYRSSPNRNPQGPPSGLKRVLRGGGWSYFPAGLRSTFRHKFDPVYQNYRYNGFRCVLPIQE